MNFHHLCSSSIPKNVCVCVYVMDLFMYLCVPFCQSACFADFVEGFVCVFLLDLSVSLLSLTLSKSVYVYLRVPSVSQPVLLTLSKGLCVHVSVCSLLSVSLFR